MAKEIKKSVQKTEAPKESKTRRLTGEVKSAKMQKTVVVVVNRFKMHKKYRKQYLVSTRYKAHDEKSEYKAGDRVIIQEVRPMSKDKRWKVVGKVKG